MFNYLSRLFQVLTAPTLPGQIKQLADAIVNVLVVIAVGISGVIGAWKILLFLIGRHN